MYTGPQIVTSGLVMHLDAGNTKSMIDAPSTNLLLRSQEIQYWNQYQATTTTNTITAPDGTLTGDTNTETNALTGNRGIQQQFITTSSSLYTFSIYAKYNGRNIQLGVFEYPGYTNFYFTDFNLQTGAVGLTGSNGGNGVFTSASITSAGNGWYRCSVSGKLVGTQSQVNINLLNTSNASSYTGDGTSGVYFWGGQFELGPLTVYIPTTTVAVSRTTWIDLTKNGNTPTLSNGPTYDYSNKGSIVFDGVNDYAGGYISGTLLSSLGTSSVLSFTGNFTLEHWIKPTFLWDGIYATSSYFGIANMIMCKGPASTYNYQTQVTNNTTLSFTKRTTPEGLIRKDFTVASLLNKITQVVFVITTTQIILYVNGSLSGTQSITGLTIAPAASDPLFIGSMNSVQYTQFTGNMYIHRIYNKVLSDTEVLQNYNATRSRFGI